MGQGGHCSSRPRPGEGSEMYILSSLTMHVVGMFPFWLFVPFFTESSNFTRKKKNKQKSQALSRFSSNFLIHVRTNRTIANRSDWATTTVRESLAITSKSTGRSPICIEASSSRSWERSSGNCPIASLSECKQNATRFQFPTPDFEGQQIDLKNKTKSHVVPRWQISKSVEKTSQLFWMI